MWTRSVGHANLHHPKQHHQHDTIQRMAPRSKIWRKPQLGFGSFKQNLPALLVKFQEQLKTTILHHAHLRWKSHVLKLDLTESNPSSTLAMCTDFGATLDLFEKEKDNFSVNNHDVACVARIVYG